MKAQTVLVITAILSAQPLVGQEPAVRGLAPEAGQRRTSVTAGFGNQYGFGFGINVERYLIGERVSVAIGTGGIPELDGSPGTLGMAAAMRGYTPGQRHRGFVETSITLIATSFSRRGPGNFDDVKRHYGPGLSVGYHYTARGGFTMTVAGGAGWAVSLDELYPIVMLGFGHSWR